MRQTFYMLLARQQRTAPVTCTMFLMLVSVLMVCANCCGRSFSKLVVCIEGNLLAGMAPLRWHWLDTERLCEIDQNCVNP